MFSRSNFSFARRTQGSTRPHGRREQSKMEETVEVDNGMEFSESSENVSSDVEVNNASSVLTKIATLYAEKLMSDLTLVVDGIEYPCHRLILCASSEVFQVMLMNPPWTESSESRIELKESKECCEVFGDFLKYFYTGNIRINYKSVLPILSLADKYNINDLVYLCVDYMCLHMIQATSSNNFVSWYQYTYNCGHNSVANTCRSFVKWNLKIVVQTEDFGNFHLDIFVNLLQQNDLVVCNELELYTYAVRWLDCQYDKVSDEEEMEQLVVEVMSRIRFPMMTPRQIAGLLLSPLMRKYHDFFVPRMTVAMAFHSGEPGPVKEALATDEGHLLFTPRLYTAASHSSLLTIENYTHLPPYYTNTLVFSSAACMAEHGSERTCEWVVDVFPKGVWFKKFYLIVWQGTVEVPEDVLRTVRLSITCKEPPSPPADVRVKVGILFYGIQDGVEHVMAMYEKKHYFSELNRVLNLDDLLCFDELNKPAVPTNGAFAAKNQPSDYLVGANRDVLKLHVVILPLDNLLEPTGPRNS